MKPTHPTQFKSHYLLRYSILILSLACSPLITWAAPDSRPTQVRITTNHGDIVIELNSEKAPISAKNFLSYVNQGFYAETLFHRVIPGFMIQGGGLTKDMAKKTTQAPIKNEATNGLKNLRGTLAMARTNSPDSATSQFFINLADNAFLDPNPRSAGYSVFGKVVKGMDVVDKIAGVPTTRRQGRADVPTDAVIITEVKRLEPPAKTEQPPKKKPEAQ